MNVLERPFLGVAEIMVLLDVKKTKAYSIISELNKELIDKKYLVIRGRVPTRYFVKRFGLDKKW